MRDGFAVAVSLQQRVAHALAERLAVALIFIVCVCVYERHAERHTERVIERQRVLVGVAERLAYALLEWVWLALSQRLA